MDYISTWFYIRSNPKLDPNAEESGKIYDFRSLNYNMYWLLENIYSENFGFGPGGFIVSGAFTSRMKRVIESCDSSVTGSSCMNVGQARWEVQTARFVYGRAHARTSCCVIFHDHWF